MYLSTPILSNSIYPKKNKPKLKCTLKEFMKLKIKNCFKNINMKINLRKKGKENRKLIFQQLKKFIQISTSVTKTIQLDIGNYLYICS